MVLFFISLISTFPIYQFDVPYIFSKEAAKVRISEQNAKGKLVFLFIFEREYLRPKVRGNAKRAKNQISQREFVFPSCSAKILAVAVVAVLQLKNKTIKR